VDFLTGAAWHTSATQQAGQPVSPEDAARVAVVMVWMAWLGRIEGDEAVKRLAAWALGYRLATLAYHERRGERTIANRITASLIAISREFQV
jgi:hypothetical protein